MATATINYAADTALITCTLAGLAHGSMRESSVVDNTTNKYMDAMVQLVVNVSNNIAIGGDKAVYCYFYGGVKPNQLTYPATGTDAAVSVASANNLVGPFVVSVSSQNESIDAVIPSVGTFFGGNLPPYWGLVFYNMSSVSLGTEAVKSYLGIKYDVA